MNCVRWLLSFGERRSQRNDTAVANPPILALPTEILLEIIDCLHEHDEFLLSQTCRAFRTLTQRDWKLAFERLTYSKQIDF